MTLEVWQHIRQEAKELAECEPMLASFFHSTILKHQNLGSALSYLLANKLANPIMPAISLREIIEEAYQAEPNIIDCAACDIKAVRHRDPAVELWSTPLLYLKGFHAIQSYRITHYCGTKIEKHSHFIYKIKFQWLSMWIFILRPKLGTALCLTMLLVLSWVKPQ